MSRLIKIWILLALIILVFVHHFLVHGYLYDESNLVSHEAIATFLFGMAVAITIWGKDK